VSKVSEARACDQTDIARAYYRDSHAKLLLWHAQIGFTRNAFAVCRKQLENIRVVLMNAMILPVLEA
jgi:hypothetical protein